MLPKCPINLSSETKFKVKKTTNLIKFSVSVKVECSLLKEYSQLFLLFCYAYLYHCNA